MTPEAAPPSKGLKVAMIVARTLMGLLFLFASITYFFKLITPPVPTGAMKVFSEGLQAAVYFMPTLMATELLCGLAFLTGRFVPLASVLIAPLIVNIVGVHVFLDRAGLPIAIFLVLANGLVAYYHRDSYRPLFKA